MRKIFFFTFQLLFTLLLLSCYGGNDREAFQNLQQVTRVEGISADDYALSGRYIAYQPNGKFQQWCRYFDI